MPRAGDKITPQERRVIDAATSPRTPKEIGALAGYSESSNGAYKALQRPAIQAEIVARQLERLHNEVLPLAVQTHIDMLTDSRTPAGAKAQLVKLAYDRALGAQESNSKDPHEMTAEEIGAALMKLQREASERAKPIIEGESAPIAPNVLD